MFGVKSTSGMIGDTIAMIPFLDAVAQRVGGIRVTGPFAEAVKPLVAHKRFTYDEHEEEGPAQMVACVSGVFAFCHNVGAGLHMGQGHFAVHGYPVPPMPMQCDFLTEPCDLEPGVLISPFSCTDCNHNKLWWPDRWSQVIDAMRYYGPVYVLGSESDDCSPYVEAGAVAVQGRSLKQILASMRESPCVITLDTGTSHLAHFGGVKNHVLLYPACLHPAFVPNARGISVRGNPSEVTPEQIIAAAETVLARG